MADETTTPGPARANRKERFGKVISNRMTKTIVVRVERRFPHPRFKKVVTGYKKFYAHDEKGDARVGDRVAVRVAKALRRPRTTFAMFEKADEPTNRMEAP